MCEKVSHVLFFHDKKMLKNTLNYVICDLI